MIQIWTYLPSIVQDLLAGTNELRDIQYIIKLTPAVAMLGLTEGNSFERQ